MEKEELEKYLLKMNEVHGAVRMRTTVEDTGCLELNIRVACRKLGIELIEKGHKINPYTPEQLEQIRAFKNQLHPELIANKVGLNLTTVRYIISMVINRSRKGIKTAIDPKEKTPLPEIQQERVERPAAIYCNKRSLYGLEY